MGATAESIGCQSESSGDCTDPSSTIKDVVSLGRSGEAIEMENLLLSCAWFDNINKGEKDAAAGPVLPGLAVTAFTQAELHWHICYESRLMIAPELRVGT